MTQSFTLTIFSSNLVNFDTLTLTQWVVLINKAYIPREDYEVTEGMLTQANSLTAQQKAYVAVATYNGLRIWLRHASEHNNNYLQTITQVVNSNTARI